MIITMMMMMMMSVFLECLSMSNMLNCPKQVHIRKYKTHAYKTPKTGGVQIIMLKHPTKQLKNKKNKPKCHINVHINNPSYTN